MPMLRERSLLYAENLTPPSFQVIVMTANMGCDRCRQRVSQVASKMTGLEECTVDVQNRRVTMKAEFGFQWKAKPGAPKSKMNKELRPLTYLLKPFRGTCFGNHLAN
ncbi:hypothetical protein F2P56_005041 [Juglans regia]|uniref:HMA domain-containing protein n=1 Tax=Juglans regia TaxID=51240 RepID=A0A833Y5U5_JUGRE|nr:hypothetical protein F2P56_005041 [Juglans regia]